MSRTLTPRGQERRRALLATAARLFAEQGYDPTSVADIVDALGAGKGVFYWYFTSKEELFAELLRDANRDLRRRQQDVIGDEPDPMHRIELGIRASLDWFAEHREHFTLLQFAASDERFTKVLRRNQEIAIDDTVRHLKDAIVEGEVPDQDPEVLAVAIVGVVERLTRTYLFGRGEPVGSVADAAVTFCLGGLRA
jgi:AcrR family transcriptional regulator